MNSSRSRTLSYFLLFGVVLVWGGTFAVVKTALTHTTPLVFNLVRMTIAFLALAVINSPSLRGLSRTELRFGAAAGILLALGYQFQTSGLAYTTPSKSAFLTGLVVVLVPLMSAIPGVAHEDASRPSLDTYLGAVLAFVGLVLLTTTPGSGVAILSGLHVGEWLSLLCAVAFAGHLLLLSRASPVVNARKLGTLQIGFAALTMLLTLPLGGSVRFEYSSPELWIALGVTALLGTAAAFTIQSWAQQHLPASHTALIFTLEPVFAWLTSLLFFDERLGPRALTGAALILAGILVAELRPASRSAQPLLPGAGG
jgi:drug/metabolite transporter (DMT)-like permease